MSSSADKEKPLSDTENPESDLEGDECSSTSSMRKDARDPEEDAGETADSERDSNSDTDSDRMTHQPGIFREPIGLICDLCGAEVVNNHDRRRRQNKAFYQCTLCPCHQGVGLGHGVVGAVGAVGAVEAVRVTYLFTYICSDSPKHGILNAKVSNMRTRASPGNLAWSNYNYRRLSGPTNIGGSSRAFKSTRICSHTVQSQI